MTDYDVIVIGCGPAGMMACGELARRGIKVLGIDKKPLLDINIRTASGYCFLDQPFNAENIKQTQKGDKTLLEFIDTGFSVVYGDTMEGIHHSFMFSDTGKYWKASTTKKPFYHVFNPHQCHADRYQWAQKMGAEFMPGTLFRNVTQTGKRVEVKVRKDGQDKTLSCKKLIAADGLCSRIAKVTGVNKTRTNFGMKGPTIEYEMANVECPHDRGDMFFFGAKNFGGRAGGIIMVPSCHGDGIYRMETMSVLPASTSSDLIEYFTKKGPFAHWFKNAEIIEMSGVVIEFLSPMITPYLGNILFVGDSAAFGECLYQSAVMAGYKGALCVEQELQGKNGYQEYTQWWGDHFEWVRSPKRMADYIKRVLFPKFFTVSELDYLFDLSKKNPIVMEQAEATPYDFTTMVMQSFMAMPEVSDDLKKRMQDIIDADMSQVVQVVGKVQKA
jgi:digeranylgeranylglycerophospholipid reductase